MKKILLIFILSIGAGIQAQVYVNVDEANQESSADLQIDSNNSGFGVPQVMLTSLTSYAPIASEPKPGLVVYNPNTNDEIEAGLYVWVAEPAPAHWEMLGGLDRKGTIIQNIDKEFLGYDPVGSGFSAPVPAGLNKQRCARWEINDGGNGHVYCAYTSTSTRNFHNTYNLARSAGGYVVTIVSDAEWDFVKDNIINDGLSQGGSALTNNIWLGYVKLKTPGNDDLKYHWITGETWENKWSNNASTQSHFASGEPQPADSNTSTRCTFINRSASDSNRLWRSQTCGTVSNMNNIIIEFNQ